MKPNVPLRWCPDCGEHSPPLIEGEQHCNRCGWVKPADGTDSDSDSDYPSGWFGASWGAEICWEPQHRDTPVGEPCMDCQEPIGKYDQGLIVPHTYLDENNRMAARLTAVHIDCFLDGLGVGHRPAVW